MSVNEALGEEFRNFGLDVSRTNRVMATSQILARGYRLFDQWSEPAGEWMQSRRESAIRTLGVGAAISQFTIAPLDCEKRYREKVSGLGGLACFIVSTFDSLVDSGAPVPELLNGKESGIQEPLQRVVRLYFEELNSLPQKHVAIRVLIEKTIQRMHRAELDSLSGRGSRSVWWRKNVLPFVVMSLPAWLANERAKGCAVERHLRWVGRMGEFLGWVDDCADLETDRKAGTINRLLETAESEPSTACVRRIARRGRRVLRDWDAMGGTPQDRDTLMVVAWSWIERLDAG
jgi:hypothetical protein